MRNTMFMYRFNVHLYFLILLLTFIIYSCSEDEKEYVLGTDFIESRTGIVMVDTFQMDMSTIIMDSMPTSGMGLALCGIIEDEYMGKVTCQTYFQLGIPYDDPELSSEDIFDSIVLIMPFNGISFGDTNQVHSVSVHRLDGDLEPVEASYFYNTSSISYEENPLARTSFIPYPNYFEKLNIRLDDTFGEELFGLLLNGSEIVESDENFLKYLKGLTVVPDTNTPSAILGYDAYYDSINLRVYYHYPADEDEVETEYFDFPIIYDYQFNSIIGDRSNTILKDLAYQKYAVPSSRTDDLTFLQGGTGVMTCLRFPTLNNYLLMENQVIVKALVILKPLASSYIQVKLPDEIILVNTNRFNHYVEVIYDSDGYEATGDFNLDDQFHEDTQYTFDITDYVWDEFSDHYFDVNHGLIVSLPTNDILSSMERIVFTAGAGESQLIIYSLYY